MVNVANTHEVAFSTNTQEQDILEDKKLFDCRLKDIKSRMSSLEIMQEEYIQFCHKQDITPDSTGVEVSRSIKAIMSKILQDFELDCPNSSDIRHYSSYVTRQNSRIRNLLLLLRQFCNHIEWSSASYSQAVVPTFFDLRKQTGCSVNYDRWESLMIADMEEDLATLYNLNDQWSLLLTSSGMAAYATINNYLTRYLSSGDNVLIPVPIYHEAESLLDAIPNLQITRLGTNNVDDIITSINSRTKVICLTPITNDEALRFVDVERLLQKISKIEQEIWIVLDGTMSGGLIRPEKFIEPNGRTKLLYFESGNKYQQFEDTAMKGIVIVPHVLKEEFVSSRREIGAILYDQAASCLPQSISHEELKIKMGRFARNALLASDRVNNDSRLKGFCKVNYPFNLLHPDVDNARQYSLMQLGGVVTFSFNDKAFFNRERLDQLIQNLIDRCQTKGIPFCKGDSYGFSIPRIQVSGPKTGKPFLRSCVGNRSFQEMEAFLDCLVDCLHEHSMWTQRITKPSSRKRQDD